MYTCIYSQAASTNSAIVMPAPASIENNDDDDFYSEENFETDGQTAAATSDVNADDVQQQQQQQYTDDADEHDDIWQSLGTSTAARTFKAAATAPQTTAAACSTAVSVVLASTDITHQWHEFGQRIGTSVVARTSKQNAINQSKSHSSAAAAAPIVLPVALQAIAIWLDTCIAPWSVAAQALTADGPTRKSITACIKSITATCSSSSKAVAQQQPDSIAKASLVLRGFYTATTTTTTASYNSTVYAAVGSKQHEQLCIAYSELVLSVNKLMTALSTQLTDTNVSGTERLQAIDTLLKAIGLVVHEHVDTAQHKSHVSSSSKMQPSQVCS
jgi:hypothetical protein